MSAKCTDPACSNEGHPILKCVDYAPEKAPKLYEGIAATSKVYVHPKDGPKYELVHHVLHSPDGFAWGYCGSGPAELARCILWDFLFNPPDPELYQKFKEDYISHFKMDENWILGSEAVKTWLEMNDAFMSAASERSS